MIGTYTFSAFVLGIVIHRSIFIRGEWHMEAPAIFALHLLLALLKLFIDYHKLELSHDAYWHTFFIITSYLAGLFASIAAYRLSPYHRLASFDGPKFAAVSKLWHVWKCRDSRNHEVMEKLQRDYNTSFVRIGPSEIVSFHPESFHVIEGYGTKCKKSDFYDLLLPDFSLVFTRDKGVHDARRNVWSRALSTNAITHYRPRINRQIEVLIKIISTAASTRSPMAVNELMYWFTFDSMGEFAFNRDFGMMARQDWHFAILLFRRALSILGPFAPTIWLIKIGFAFFFWFWKISDWFSMLAFCKKRMDERMLTTPQEKDISSYFLEEAERDRGPFTENWLKGDTATVVVAGSDTTAPTLIFLLYALAQHPEHADKICQELEDIDPFDLNSVSALPHLNGTINEAMRLYSVAPTVVSRQSPPEGITIGDTFIPGDTKILAPRWVIFKLESCFERAKEFIPERWYSRKEMVKNKHAFSPFGNGRASCVGQTLAITQLRLVCASIVKRFHINFRDGDDGGAVLRDMKDQLTAQPGLLTLIFVPRE